MGRLLYSFELPKKPFFLRGNQSWLRARMLSLMTYNTETALGKHAESCEVSVSIQYTDDNQYGVMQVGWIADYALKQLTQEDVETIWSDVMDITLGNYEYWRDSFQAEINDASEQLTYAQNAMRMLLVFKEMMDEENEPLQAKQNPATMDISFKFGKGNQ